MTVLPRQATEELRVGDHRAREGRAIEARLFMDRGMAAASHETERRRAELHADLVAVAGGLTGGLEPDRFCGYPAILRRVGSLLAEALPADVDHLVTEGLCGTAVSAAVALHTGIPFAALPAENARGFGNLYRGERVWAVLPVVMGGETPDLLNRARAAGVHVSGLLAVAYVNTSAADRGIPARGLAPLHTLFTFEFGEDAT